ncbi:MAG: GNAT family N-acetyltransferase [Chloroflexi bacterium]|uniref:GNAT family N-acetyltransferase n=1 Tax=Candidatus Flexifilum breve TaxID=3140694 RepID=UPI0031361046|nr:GNAT family N-acetyltransferase [Chloroflexota bacterium]
MTTAPDYRLDLDVVVVAPDGQFAAFAQGWVDAENGIGLFEPVGTHPDFRKLGLCRAVIYEGLRRMHAAGATEAHVYPYENHDASQVYRKLGFQTRGKIIAYRKAL